MNREPALPHAAGAGSGPHGAVLDTNVWLDWLVFADPGVDALRSQVRDGRIRLLSLPRGRDELARDAVRAQAVAARRRRGLHDDGEHDPLRAIVEFDAIVEIRPAAAFCGLACRDPDDQCFVDLAVAHRARWLLTKDRALLSLARAARRHFDLRIVPPAAFPGQAGGCPARSAGL
jgi:predicted nucleic acid-binding protein